MSEIDAGPEILLEELSPGYEGRWHEHHGPDNRVRACADCRREEAHDRLDGLTFLEGIVSDHLVAAVEAFGRLDRQHPQEIDEFITAIHQCQGLLTTRIARRHYPKGWPTYA